MYLWLEEHGLINGCEEEEKENGSMPNLGEAPNRSTR